MQITDYLSEVVTSTPSQSLGDADLEPRKSLPPPTGTAPTALAAATEFPNCGYWKCPSVSVWHGTPVARKGNSHFLTIQQARPRKTMVRMTGVKVDLGSGLNLPFSSCVTVGLNVFICRVVIMTQPQV